MSLPGRGRRPGHPFTTKVEPAFKGTSLAGELARFILKQVGAYAIFYALGIAAGARPARLAPTEAPGGPISGKDCP